MTTREQQIQARCQAAEQMVRALCQARGTDGAREWLMSIPARPDYDPDLVIDAALSDIPYLLARLAACEAALAPFKKLAAELERMKVARASRLWLADSNAADLSAGDIYDAAALAQGADNV